MERIAEDRTAGCGGCVASRTAGYAGGKSIEWDVMKREIE
jgi:hypothetical protein